MTSVEVSKRYLIESSVCLCNSPVLIPSYASYRKMQNLGVYRVFLEYICFNCDKLRIDYFHVDNLSQAIECERYAKDLGFNILPF